MIHAPTGCPAPPPDDLATNLTLVDRLRPLAGADGISVAHLATARVVARGREPR
ncbi:hypothetical protein [Streptomyces sp. enrichment culture]|uniref:hypothetical protein n=1 Tax=Streptomyces sp. enrichment culture TaxID=1795815 RepID=UPI003F552824